MVFKVNLSFLTTSKFYEFQDIKPDKSHENQKVTKTISVLVVINLSDNQ